MCAASRWRRKRRKSFLRKKKGCFNLGETKPGLAAGRRTRLENSKEKQPQFTAKKEKKSTEESSA